MTKPFLQRISKTLKLVLVFQRKYFWKTNKFGDRLY